jgi:hypothetical protein
MPRLLGQNVKGCMQTATTEIKPDIKILLKIAKAALNWINRINCGCLPICSCFRIASGRKLSL